jgi:F-type H+-transporting ATPase subunit a
MIWLATMYPPIRPHVQLPAEPLSPTLFEFAGQPFTITNTFVAAVIAELFLILIAFLINRQIKQGKMVVEGISGVFALLLEGIYGLTESTAGKWTKKIFPIFATITMLLFAVNLMELIPGVDSIGLLHPSEHGNPVQELLPGFSTIVKGETPTDTAAAGEHAEHGSAELYGLYPFVRVASTDLSFTVALAIVAVLAIQWIGLKALGMKYTRKYLDLSGLVDAWKKPGCGGPLGLIMGFVQAVVVGPLEIVAEISKIISFAFRLFGNIFAGAIVLFVMGALGYFLQTPFLLLELIVGLIQAFVFGVLTMVFMSMATQSHDDHAEESHH